MKSATMPEPFTTLLRAMAIIHQDTSTPAICRSPHGSALPPIRSTPISFSPAKVPKTG